MVVLVAFGSGGDDDQELVLGWIVEYLVPDR